MLRGAPCGMGSGQEKAHRRVAADNEKMDIEFDFLFMKANGIFHNPEEMVEHEKERPLRARGGGRHWKWKELVSAYIASQDLDLDQKPLSRGCRSAVTRRSICTRTASRS